jgi:hypothetical protein
MVLDAIFQIFSQFLGSRRPHGAGAGKHFRETCAFS